jgi:predicted RNA-binding Zn-ribbon protein involved in translation (DUF1610 family)
MILPGYTRPSRLKRFIRVLLGTEPFDCPHCGERHNYRNRCEQMREDEAVRNQI